jgi:hypothetical protein
VEFVEAHVSGAIMRGLVHKLENALAHALVESRVPGYGLVTEKSSNYGRSV